MLPFATREGKELVAIIKTETGRAFAFADLGEGIKLGIYRAFSKEHAMRAKENDAAISSAFTVWHVVYDSMKGLFVAKLFV